MFAIFGFCDIRYFSDITEVLEEGVMIFVNEVARIVHSNVSAGLGAANKNIGDAFLLVWRIPDTEVIENNGEMYINPGRKTAALADMSLYSFMTIIADINKNEALQKY